ncbi:MAG: hypothetical protein KTR25_17665 [Myxococcales bacterium]|nr:hypothetical protein [Myxococcales bacterium]
MNIVRGLLSVVFGAILTTQAATAVASCDDQQFFFRNFASVKCTDSTGEVGRAQLFSDGEFCHIIFNGDAREQNIVVRDAQGRKVIGRLFQEEGDFFGEGQECLDWVSVLFFAT